METKKYSLKTFSTEIVMGLIAILCLAPFYFLVVNSFKSYGELLTNAANLPSKLNWENYVTAWEVLQLGTMLTNTILITVASNVGVVLIAAMAAYKLSRKPTRTNRTLLFVFLAAMVIPFQVIMIPLVKVAAWFHLVNSIPGIVICYLGLTVSFSIFLFQGFIRSIPIELEEAAIIDGCSPYGVFWRIILPLLKPMTVTIVLLNSFFIWNDFLLPLIMLQNKELHTIQVAINSLFSEYANQWDIALAALVLSIIPILLFFFALQRQIIKGITSGAIKG